VSGGTRASSNADRHRGNTRAAVSTLDRGRRVDRAAVDLFMAPAAVHSSGRVVPPPVPPMPPPKDLRPVAPLLPPTARLAIVSLTRAHRESTVALAIAGAGRLARATARDGALATVGRDLVKIGRGFGSGSRRAPALAGFEPIAAHGPVAVLDSDDAHAAAVASSGRVPLVCVVPADEALASALADIQPSALLLIADADTSESYLALARGDLAAGRPSADVLVARYAVGAPAFDGAIALRVDPAAGYRLRLGLAPSSVTRANAELVARRVTEGR
jgi:hypothetical protein